MVLVLVLVEKDEALGDEESEFSVFMVVMTEGRIIISPVAVLVVVVVLVPETGSIGFELVLRSHGSGSSSSWSERRRPCW